MSLNASSTGMLASPSQGHGSKNIPACYHHSAFAAKAELADVKATQFSAAATENSSRTHSERVYLVTDDVS